MQQKSAGDEWQKLTVIGKRSGYVGTSLAAVFLDDGDHKAVT